MAVCEQGYLCEVCGPDVADITESDLYLRYVLGEVDPETLHVAPERHLRCNPTLAQFIVAEGFAPVVVEGLVRQGGARPGVRRRGGGAGDAGLPPAPGAAGPWPSDHRISLCPKSGPAGKDPRPVSESLTTEGADPAALGA